MRRFASVIGLREEAIDLYEEHHRNVWPDVLAALHRANIRNYSIYRHGTLLFSYREYVGDDYEADMRALDNDPTSITWVKLMQTLQVSVDPAAPGKWLELDEVFRLD